MIKTKLTAAACGLAQRAHQGQLDKGGEPYINHPMHVAEQMETEEETCVALLHDVIEDSDYTAEDLRAIGMPESVVEAVELLTHDPAQSYVEYIVAIKENPLAAKVKHADLEHNSDVSRIKYLTTFDMKRRSKYLEALAILDGTLDPSDSDIDVKVIRRPTPAVDPDVPHAPAPPAQSNRESFA